MTSFSIQTIKFELKRATWINHKLPHSYSLPALETDGITIGTTRADSNVGNTTRSRRAPPLVATQASTSARAGDTASYTDATASGST
jgi:hypothetical protein